MLNEYVYAYAANLIACSPAPASGRMINPSDLIFRPGTYASPRAPWALVKQRDRGNKFEERMNRDRNRSAETIKPSGARVRSGPYGEWDTRENRDAITACDRVCDYEGAQSMSRERARESIWKNRRPEDK